MWVRSVFCPIPGLSGCGSQEFLGIFYFWNIGASRNLCWCDFWKFKLMTRSCLYCLHATQYRWNTASFCEHCFAQKVQPKWSPNEVCLFNTQLDICLDSPSCWEWESRPQMNCCFTAQPKSLFFYPHRSLYFKMPLMSRKMFWILCVFSCTCVADSRIRNDYSCSRCLLKTNIMNQ